MPIIKDGAPATIKIVEKDADGKDDPVTTLSAVVSGGKIKCQWQVTYTPDEDDADSQRERLRRMEERMHGPVDQEAAVGPPVGKVECWKFMQILLQN